MFKELLPVLRHRAVLMTITSTGDDEIRVNVVPKKLKNDENNALTTPLSVTGTAEELDADLGSTLVEFVGSHLQLKNNLQQAKADMEAASKQAQAEVREKQKNLKKPTGAAATNKPAQQTAKPAATPAAEPVTPPPPRTASLFDMPTPQPAAAPVSAPVPIATVAPARVAEPVTELEEPSDEDEESEILSETNEDESDEDSFGNAA